jgi:hypothetical protein
MVKLNVPKEFIEVLIKVERDVKPEHVIEALEWAAENPEKARKVAEGFSKLGYLGRKEFEICIWLGNDPEKALETAEKRQADVSKNRSLLGKVLAGAKKGGYEFKMPNGVDCTVRYREGQYEFTFNLGGAEVTLIREGGRHLSLTLDELLEGHVSRYRIGTIIYKGKVYYTGARQAEAIINAIEQNVSPEVEAVVGE